MIALSFLLSLSACLLWTGAEGQLSGSLRLVARDGRTSSSLTAGRLEVYYSGQWGTVCANNFGQTEADVACRQLGFPSGAYDYQTISIAGLSSFSASSYTPIWLNQLSCISSRRRLIDCAPIGSIGNVECSHAEDIALYCRGNGALRLSSSSFVSLFLASGRLEVYYNGVWGTVCNDLFDQTDANVACRQLGYSSAVTYGTVGSLGYSQGTGFILLDNVQCTSSELMLSSCSHNRFGVHNCVHSEDVALSCGSSGVSIFTGAVIAGIVIAVVVPLCCIGICVTIVVIAVCTGACAAGATSRRRGRNVNTNTTTSSAAATVVTSTGTTTTGYTPQAGYTPYPADLGKKELKHYPADAAQPLPYPADPAYPPQPQHYPTSGYVPPTN